VVRVKDTPPEELLERANASGFPLQMSIEHEIQHHFAGPISDPWRVIKSEVPWRDKQTGEEGFVDLLVSNDVVCFVVECKRRTGGNWTFLVPPDEVSRRHLRFCVTGLDRNLNCLDYGSFDPPSPEAEHCVVPGAATGERSLDRIASKLVQATECIALEFQEMDRGGAAVEKVAFVPLIITIPKPAVAYVDPASISTADGTLDASTRIETVDFVRFRKAFRASSPIDGTNSHETLNKMFEDRERSVLIVHSEYFSTYLSGLWHLSHGTNPWKRP